MPVSSDSAAVRKGQGHSWRVDGPVVVFCASFMTMGAVLSYFGYLWGDALLNPNELAGSLFFWGGFVTLLLAVPLRRVTRTFLAQVRRASGAALLAVYLTIHLLLYGFVLEAILTTAYGVAVLAESPALLVTTNNFYPPSLLSTGFDLAYNPSVLITLPPVFSAALSMYSVSVAVVVAVLVVTSVGETRQLSKLSAKGKARSYVVFPALGIVFGASCCLSVAGIVSLVVPSAALTSIEWVYYATYFLLPLVAMVLLYLNLLSIRRISESLLKGGGQPIGQAHGKSI